MTDNETRITGGTVYDGTGAPPRCADVVLRDGRVQAVGDLPSTGSSRVRVIDAAGLAVCPGFIDIHSHSEFTYLADPGATGKVRQGVTTEIIGNCGLAGGPLKGAYREHRQADLDEYGIGDDWGGLGEFLDLLEARRPVVNIATLAGHGNIRGAVVGMGRGPVSEADLNAMQRLLAESMDEGAFGLSAGLIYPPGVFSDRRELQALARVTGRCRAIFAFHMRSEADELCSAVDEVLGVGAASGSHVHISHLKTAGRKNWSKLPRVIDAIARARSRGIDVTADRYPYTASATDLDTVLPAETFDGGRGKGLERLREPRYRARLIADLEAETEGDQWERIVVSSVGNPDYAWAEGLALNTVAERLKKSPAEAAVILIDADEARTQAVFHTMSEENMATILRLPYVGIGSDSATRDVAGPTARGKPHPRGFGTFPAVLGGLVRERGLFSLEEAIRKMTGLNAETVGLTDRGRLVEGAAADVVVFDPERVRDRADYRNPFRAPEGIVHVWVNGVAAIRDGEPTGERSGAIIRRRGRV